MAPSVAPLYAALLGVLLVYLSSRVLRLRRRLKVAIGVGGEAAIERAARVTSGGGGWSSCCRATTPGARRRWATSADITGGRRRS